MKTHGYGITQARLHRKTLCYSLVRGNAETLDQIVATLPQVLGCANSSMIHGIIQQRLPCRCNPQLFSTLASNKPVCETVLHFTT